MVRAAEDVTESTVTTHQFCKVKPTTILQYKLVHINHDYASTMLRN